MGGERWASIAGVRTEYEVSDHGRVRSLVFHNNQVTKRRAVPLIMKIFKGVRGYPVVGLRFDGQRRVIPVHRLVLSAFVGPCPAGMEGAHLDGNKMNNWLDNLKWATPAENNSHKINHGTLLYGSRIHSAKLQERDIPVIVRRLKSGESQRAIARDFHVSSGTINFIARGKTWKQVLSSIGNELSN